MSAGIKISPEKAAKVAALYGAGVPTREITRTEQVSGKTVVKCARAAGLQIRPLGRTKGRRAPSPARASQVEAMRVLRATGLSPAAIGARQVPPITRQAVEQALAKGVAT